MFKRLTSIFFHSFHYSKADSSFGHSEYNRAISDLSKAIQANPNNPAAYHDRGIAHQALGDYRESIDDFDKALEIARLPVTYFSRGISWKFLGKFDRAIADQTQAIALLPSLADAYGELGVVYQCGLDFDASIASLTTALDLAPRESSHFKHRGLALFYRGDFKAAAADLERALDLANDAYAMLFLYLARAKTSENPTLALERCASKLTDARWPAAIFQLYLGRLSVDSAVAAAATPDELAEAQFYVGEWHLIHDRRAEARKAFQMAAQSCPTWFSEYPAAIAELKRME
jgi:lipoprotein NlpI